MCPWVQPEVSPVAPPAGARQLGAVAVDVVAGRWREWCTRWCRGARVSPGCAHLTGVDECIHGCPLGQAGAGQGQDSARSRARQVPEQCQ